MQLSSDMCENLMEPRSELQNRTSPFPDTYNKVDQIPPYPCIPFGSYYQPWNSYNGSALSQITNYTEHPQQTLVSSESCTSANYSPSHSLSPCVTSPYTDRMSSPTASFAIPCPLTVPYDKNILLGTPASSTSIYRSQIANHTSSFEDVKGPLVSPERQKSNIDDSGKLEDVNKPLVSPERQKIDLDDSGNSSNLSSTSISPSNKPVTDGTPSIPLQSGCNRELIIKKNSRTNYSPQQIRSLEKIFQETPYPEVDVIEQLSTDLSIPEKNLKIWFQNKRARFRKRVQSNKPTFLTVYPSYQAPIPPTASPYNMLSPSSLISPVVASQVASRPVSNLPSKSSSTIQTPYQLYPTQIPHYASYAYPYMFSQMR